MLAVFSLFLIPIGGGIPAGVLLGRDKGLSWLVMSALYFVSDLVLAVAFEPLMHGVIALGKKVPPLARAVAAIRESTSKTAAKYGTPGAGPVSLILIAFGVDPMTGRAAAHAAGHGFVGGWAIAITGDMFYFWVVMLATLRLNKYFGGDPQVTVGAVLMAMILIPVVIRRVRDAWKKKR